MSVRGDQTSKKKLRLWRAALYGLIAAVIVYIINNAANDWQEFATWSQARPGEMVGYAIGRFGFLPMLFILIAFIRNRFV